MRVLWLATKCPWPAVDGGRLVQLETLQALASAGVEVVLVAPAPARSEEHDQALEALSCCCRAELVPTRPLPRLLAVARTGLGPLPMVVARHERPRLARRVDSLLQEERFEVLHVEQVHLVRLALENRRTAVVVRCQNVESALWAETARGSSGAPAWLLRREAARMRTFESKTLARADAVVTLSVEDALHLEQMSGRPVAVVPAPFPSTLPTAPKQLEGDPCLVLFGSGTWRPNREGAAWWTTTVWPRVAHALPQARLHIFTGTPVPASANVVVHAPPDRSLVAFPSNAIQVVAPTVSSGIRMKILEAWARGNPVLTTTAGARGLGATSGKELWIADEPSAIADAVRLLAGDAGLRRLLVEGGRRLLERNHDPAHVAQRLLAIYGAAKA